MRLTPVEPVLDALTAWAGEAERPIDLAHAKLMVEVLAEELGLEAVDDLAHDTVERLLLQAYPDCVELEPLDVPVVLRTFGDLVDFAADRAELDRDEARALRHELDERSPDFTLIMTGQADLDDVDLDGLDVNLKDAFGLPDRLPALRLPADDELAAAARASVLLDRIRTFGAWLGDGIDLDERADLGDDDVTAAAEQLGLGRDEADVPLLLALAEELGFAAVESDDDEAGEEGADGMEDAEQARAMSGDGSEWPDGDDDDVLGVWRHAMSTLLAWGLADDAMRADEDQLDFAGAGVGFLTLFLARHEGVPRSELSDMIKETATAGLADDVAERAWQAWVAEHGDPAIALFDRLRLLGAVEIDEFGDTTDTGDEQGEMGEMADATVRLTPLSLHAMRLELEESDVEVPLLPPRDEMTAADLVAASFDFTEDELTDETDHWFAKHTPEDAARELLVVAADGGHGERVVGTSLAAQTGSQGEPAWREVLDVPRLRPYAKVALSALSPDDETLTPDTSDLAWLLADMLSGVDEETAEPDEIAEQVAETVPAGEIEIFDQVWRLDHPHAADALNTVGTYHPDKATAKAARKAAFKAANRVVNAE